MDRLRVRRPSRFLHFIISDRGACRRVRPDFYIYLYRPVLLNSDNPRRRHRNPPLRADLPLPPSLRRYAAIYILHDFLSLSLFPPPLFFLSLSPLAFYSRRQNYPPRAATFDHEVFRTRRPRIDSFTVWNHFSIIALPPLYRIFIRRRCTSVFLLFPPDIFSI